MKFRPTNNRPDTAAFTMVEIAICLAIIGFALVAIIGVLPLGMNTQRDNREETIINQDATVLLEAVRNGTHGANDLTNYVYAITNHWASYNGNGNVNNNGINGYTYTAASLNGTPNAYYSLTNGAHIVGLLSTPEFTDLNGIPISSLFNTAGYSNHIVAYVRSLSGLAAEKPPQDNQIMKEDTFSYRILCVNAPVPFDTNIFNLAFAQRQYVNQLSANLHELRMTFLWPQLPNGKLGNGHQTFRATIAGQLLPDRNNNNLYFYQSQSFTNAP
jgi:type II secretory pathway pseudopilin PulG